MKFYQIKEGVGRIVKGVNTTPDVGPNEISKQAKKFGNTVDKDGRPPTLSKKVKGSKTNVLFNLGMAESIEERSLSKGETKKKEKYVKGMKKAKDDFKDRYGDDAKAVMYATATKMAKKKKNESIEESIDLQHELKPGTYKHIYRDIMISIEDDGSVTFMQPAEWEIEGDQEYLEYVQGMLNEPSYWTSDLEMAKKKKNESVTVKDLDAPTLSIPELAEKYNVDQKEVLTQVKKGVRVEAEHTTDFDIALEIALDHLNEDLYYYDKLKFVEADDSLGEIASSSQIYVDMDGVLADFFGEWARLMDVEHFTDINKKHNIDDALQKIRDTDDFWLRLPMLPEAKNLLNLIKQVKGSYNICSSPLADDPNSEKHKRTWVEQNLNFFPPDNVYITHDKAQYATNQDGTPNILIDDYGVNIRKWEAAGGIGFKYKDHKFERTAKVIKQHMQEPVQENFADGKVKGKSRPGRVKKSGASCNGSVTALRKRAKNASGEKAKMYHWCANMKSGKKKG